MNYLDDPQRETVIAQMLNANTLPKVRAAQSVLRQWRIRYSDDFNILDAGEQLSLIEDALLEEVSSEYLDALFMLMEVVEEQVGECLPPVQAERELAGRAS
jgi:hypothetical protein